MQQRAQWGRQFEKLCCKHQDQRRCAPDARADILLQPMEKTVLKHIPTLQPIGDLMLQEMNMLWRKLQLMKKPCWSSHVKNCGPWRGPTLERKKSFMKKQKQRQQLSVPHASVLLWFGGESIMKLNLGRRDWRKYIFRFWFSQSYSH